MLTADDFQKLTQVLVIKEEFEELKEKVSNLPTKQEFFTKMDEVMNELKTIREEHVVLNGKVDRTDERVENLEKIHPDGTHASR
mgnify:CR=1 FL=1